MARRRRRRYSARPAPAPLALAAPGEPRGADLGDGCREAWGQLFAFDAPPEPLPAPLGTTTKKPAFVAPQQLTSVHNSGRTGVNQLRELEKQQAAHFRRCEARDGRAALQRLVSRISTLPRVGACGARVVPNSAPVLWRRYAKNGGHALAHFSGLQRCGSVWACPVCAPKIRQGRATDADAAAAAWLEERGAGSVALLTLTIPHHAGAGLSTWLYFLKRALSHILAGHARKQLRARAGMLHYIRSYDFTHGPNGWHPHIHALLFLDAPLDPVQLEAAEALAFRLWDEALERAGLSGALAGIAVKLESARCRADVSRYVCQVIGSDQSDVEAWGLAQETMRSDLKRASHEGHRSPWQLLEDIADTGDYDDVTLWREYERETRGLHAVRWSKGLRDAVALAEPASDAELAATEPAEELYSEPELVFRFQHDDWSLVRRAGVLQVLHLAEHGGAKAVSRYVEELRDRWRWEQEAKSGALRRAGLDDLGIAPPDIQPGDLPE